MQVYREGPAHAELPFSRQHLLVYRLLVVGTSLTIVLAAVPLISNRAFEDGGWGMYVLALVGLTLTTALALLAAWLVRGRPTPTAIAVALPGVPAFLSALLFVRPMAVTVQVVTSNDPSDTLDVNEAARILAEGTSEADALLIYGCALSACAFLAVAVALLASAASVDRGSASPAGRSWIAPLVLGVFASATMIATRVVMHELFGESVFTVLAFVLMTALAFIAARNGQFVRQHRERLEANRWVASVFNAAIAAAAAVALMDVVAELRAERTGLGAISSEGLDFSQRARVLLLTVEETRASHLYAWVDGALAFAIVGSALLGAMGPRGRTQSRTLFSGATFIALGGVMATAVAVIGVRTSTRHSCEVAAVVNTARNVPPRAIANLDLPTVPDVVAFATGEGGGPTLVVQASGTSSLSRPLRLADDSQMVSGETNLDVFADRNAKWSDVAHAIGETLTHFSFRQRRLPRVSIHVASTASRSLTQVDEYGYALFLGSFVSAIQVRLETDGDADYAPPSVSARGDETMGAVVDHIAAVNRGHDAPLLRAPNGDWRQRVP